MARGFTDRTFPGRPGGGGLDIRRQVRRQAEELARRRRMGGGGKPIRLDPRERRGFPKPGGVKGRGVRAATLSNRSRV